MIEELLPACVAAAESREDPADAYLFPEEEALLTRAVGKRRREFTTARWCARQAMAHLGLPPAPVLPGPRREPRWPDGVVGSITHCDGYRAAVLARAADLASVGVDAEPHGPLPDGVLDSVALPEERAEVDSLLKARPEVSWDRLLFSAKESVYKAWFPLTGRWLGFEQAALTIAPDAGTFTARLLVPGPVVDGRRLPGFEGRWMARDGLVLTAIAVPAPRPADGAAG
ncbi:4'-phosphopantetheinyl transferase family protein [Allostreptomyces psammosilenae]|uniref:4'-phosphopantetheinyl transferase EntD n=1 Tax=Allostreptomyces psammosilenae TaxID=1892865 RepID=A0A852ZX08_9ACTN|nr:4'-phosphopantetheinyl transferase superfamily protein [Allostreptomyces psammosilenae]NYI06933.1 4'-phosphopantetheinyl transferase EntD [Allostreptomyces psammosilenae]